MKHSEDLFPHSDLDSESYLISSTPVSIFKIAQSLSLLLCSSLPLALRGIFKGEKKTFPINNVPVGGKKIIYSLFLYFSLSLAVR